MVLINNHIIIYLQNGTFLEYENNELMPIYRLINITILKMTSFKNRLVATSK